ncbi:MAG: YdbH domain-containing protein [Proteobacteria bacterium]|nr:YdbH domain-containing protein [Pseudomonadota bacterium]
MPESPSPSRLRRRHWLLGGAAALAALGWAGRFTLADRLIGGTLADLHVPGRYTIEAVGPGQQVLTGLVLGDPAHPDLTVRRLVIDTGLGGIAGVRAEGVRLYGRVAGGRLSFGSLDQWLNQPAATPLRLPGWGLTLIDARAALGGELGPVGLAISGSGGLADGFAGRLAMAAPRLAARHCAVVGAKLDGRVTTHGGRAELTGPLAADRLDCPEAGVAMARPLLGLGLTSNASLDGGEARLQLASGALRLAALHGARGEGEARLALASGKLGGDYRLALGDAAGAGVAARRLEARGKLDGTVASIAGHGSVSGEGLGALPALLAVLDRARGGAAGTMAEPLLARMIAGLKAMAGKGQLRADYDFLRDARGLELEVPLLGLRDGAAPRPHVIEVDGDGLRGNPLIAAHGLALHRDGGIGGMSAQMPARIALGGPLPPMRGRLEAIPGGTRARLEMPGWAAGPARLTMPGLDLTLRGGRATFHGSLAASGPVPGGSVQQLAVPVDGQWSARGGLVLGQQCMAAHYAGARLGSLTLASGQLPLCPDGPALLAHGRLAARLPRLALAGRLGEQDFALNGGPLRLVGGAFSSGPLAVTLGRGEEISRFALGRVEGQLAGLSGRFSGGTVALAAVPLDIGAAAGNWHWGDGRLDLAGLGFTVADRAVPGAARFEPLAARDAGLSLADGRITAQADLRHPASDRVVAEVWIDHRLADARGQARLVVPDLRFDGQLQPDMLSHLALGTVANVAGAVSGEGQIDWAGGQVTSHGRFTTPGLDLAAAFGPAKGVAGTVEFTDLLGLVTAPDQRLTMAAINPGIEVTGGTLRFALQPGHVLAIGGAEWPFLDGKLRLRPTTMTLGAAEVRHYVLEVEGIEAAEFLQQTQMSNIGATGRFDGALPLVFDANGGRIEGGLLTSRPPGGNVSYIGALTYQDLSPMANFAFTTLKSLNYKQMAIGMEGSLAGELVTRLRIEGVSQGAGTRRNFLTRQVARLPLRFNINVRGRFFELIGLVRSTYDATYLLDPCTAGLIDAQGRPVKGNATTAPALCPNAAQPAIQPSVSEKRP